MGVKSFTQWGDCLLALMSRKGCSAPVAVHSRQRGIPFCGKLEISYSTGKLFPHGCMNAQIVVTARDQRPSLFGKHLQLLRLRRRRDPRPFQRTPLNLLAAEFRSGLDVALSQQLFGYLEFAFSLSRISVCQKQTSQPIVCALNGVIVACGIDSERDGFAQCNFRIGRSLRFHVNLAQLVKVVRI
jgi:hypothetical protein